MGHTDTAAGPLHAAFAVRDAGSPPVDHQNGASSLLAAVPPKPTGTSENMAAIGSA